MCAESVCVPSIRVMLDGLGVYFTAAHVFYSQWEPLAILDLCIPHSLQVGLLYFTVFCPNDFPISVHGHGWLFTTHLQSRDKQDIVRSKNFTFTIKVEELPSCTHFDNDAAFIVAQCYIVGAPQAAHTPHSLHAVVQGALQAISARMPNTHRTYRGYRYCYTNND